VISAAQIRAARALLGISASELASRAKVGWATVQRFEAQKGVPQSRSTTLQRIQETLEDAGVVFLGDPVDCPGVQLQRKQPEQRG
jgi:predicted transcriptional regulator